nr:PREDICTED: uncharacterized protein LOC109035731 [Bemisia tabaci]
MIQLIGSAFESVFNFLITTQDCVIDIPGFLTSMEKEITDFFAYALRTNPTVNFKTYLELECVYIHLVLEDLMTISHTTKTYRLMNESEIVEVYDKLQQDILREETEFFTHKRKNILPTQKTKWVEFTNYRAKQFVPTIIYVDLECMLKKIDKKISSNSTFIQEHIVTSWCSYTVSIFDDTKKPITYRGPEAIDKLLDHIEAEVKETSLYYQVNEPYALTNEERVILLEQAKFCHICEKMFKFGETKCIDHSHYTGEIIGVAHVPCNLKMARPKIVLVCIHNLIYDSHPVLKGLAKKQRKINVIPTTEEKFLSINVYFENGFQYKFIDSFKFLQSSLEKLASMLEDEDLIHVKKHLPKNLLPYVKGKQYFPYEWLDSLDKYDISEFPKREHFYSCLKSQTITEEQYNYAFEFYKAAGCRNIGEFSDIYNLLDTLLLSDLFENFRYKLHKEFRLDVANYLSLPHFSYDAMLYVSQIKIELMTDINQINFVSHGIRGGVANCIKKFSEAKNKYLGDDVDPADSTFIALFDAVSLYSWSLQEPVPTGNFKFLTQKEIDDFDIEQTEINSSVGWILAVDLSYPSTIHEKHRDFPFCPENMIPPNGYSKQPKLLCTLYDKSNYVIHYRLLKLAIKHGLVLKKIHSAMSFTQARIIKPYIDKTIALRKAAKNEFESTIFKFCNNAIYGRCMMNTKKRIDLELCTTTERFRKLACDNFFKRSTVYDENFAAVHRIKKYIKHNTPIHIAQTILDVSKCKLYEFHYDILQAKFKDSFNLLLQDTDSEMIECRDDVYKFIGNNMEYFDTSGYPKNHELYSEKNKKVPGVFTEEFNGQPIRLMVGLRAKMYCLKLFNDYEKKRAKGVKRAILQHEITMDDYLTCLLQKKEFYHYQFNILSRNHILYTQKSRKKTLSSYDDKRIAVNSHETIPYGYFYYENHKLLLQKVHKELVDRFKE